MLIKFLSTPIFLYFILIKIPIIDINKRFNINNTKLTYTSFPKIFSDFNIKIEDTTPTGIIKINPTITLLKYIFLSAIGNIFFIQIHFPSSESET